MTTNYTGPESQGLVERLRWQAHWCGRLGSQLYAKLLAKAADDVERKGVVADHHSDPPGSALALRLMGAVHRLVLEDLAPELARHYPSAGGHSRDRGAWNAFVALLAARGETIRTLLHSPVQTNEVGRSAALMGGFLFTARHTGFPLRILEIGASAGLNLRWDRYLYEAHGATWGKRSSPVRLCYFDVPPVPPFEITAQVAHRSGCDPNPVDPTTDEGRITLMSYVWPDQLERFRVLRAALEVAAHVPAEVARAAAVDWLPAQLRELPSGVATVVFHSIVWQYLHRQEQDEVRRVIEETGARAGEGTPLAWLRMEPARDMAEVRLTLWPGGEERLIATAGYHGKDVRWLA